MINKILEISSKTLFSKMEKKLASLNIDCSAMAMTLISKKLMPD
jgi:hypothetical protein